MSEYKVTATHILTTPFIVYAAWEPLAGHSASMFDGAWYGELTARPLPPEIDALPYGSPERHAAVTAWHEDRYQESYAAILAAYPHLRRKRTTVNYCAGTITQTCPSVKAAQRAGDPIPSLAGEV